MAKVLTHNDRLCNKASEGELYYLNATVKEQGVIFPLEIDDFSTVKEGLAGVLNELDNNDGIPLILTEGKTDQKILNTAWSKLYGEEIMPFKIISSGIQIDEDSRTGSADSVRRTLEYISTLTDQKIIGLFDNDKEGNERFKGLNQQIFEDHSLASPIRKHLTKDIYGMLLPVPVCRNIFVTDDSLKQRYLVIEHYFSDEILDNNDMKDEAILGTQVFEISGRKNDFSNNCTNLETNDFEEFHVLFNEFRRLLEIA